MNTVKKALHEQTVQNTELLRNLGDFTEQKLSLEATLNKSTVITGIDHERVSVLYILIEFDT